MPGGRRRVRRRLHVIRNASVSAWCFAIIRLSDRSFGVMHHQNRFRKMQATSRIRWLKHKLHVTWHRLIHRWKPSHIKWRRHLTSHDLDNEQLVNEQTQCQSLHLNLQLRHVLFIVNDSPATMKLFDRFVQLVCNSGVGGSQRTCPSNLGFCSCQQFGWVDINWQPFQLLTHVGMQYWQKTRFRHLQC